MSKKIFIIFLVNVGLAFSGDSYAQKLTRPESLAELLNKVDEQRVQKITRLFYNRYLYTSAFDQYLQQTIDSLKKYDVTASVGLHYLAQILILRREQKLEEAEVNLFKAIEWAQENESGYLLYNFYLNLAFTKADKRDDLYALHAYRLARREAIKLDDKILLASTDLGIANVYAALQLYNQSLFYLDQIIGARTGNDPGDRKFTFFSHLSKAGIFFFTKNIDSLKYHTQKAISLNEDIFNAKKELDRLHYYNLMLQGNYREAIPMIESLLLTERTYATVDNINLANCFFKTGNYAGAGALAQKLISDSTNVASHIKIEAYALLEKLALHYGDNSQILHYRTAALIESEAHSKSITGIADLASQIRLDQMDTFYQAQTSIYKRERVILLFALLAFALGALVIGISYHTIRQKRRYEKLLREGRDKELTFLNSHKTRKHLSNILGLCTLVDATSPDKDDLRLYFNYVFEAATEMDEWLQEVNNKLAKEK